MLMHTDGAYECLESSGLPLAVLENAIYEEVCVEIQKGDRLLFFSDGAVEVLNAAGKMLGVDGLIEILRKQGYPDADIQMNALEEALLVYSNSIRLDDDLTLVEMRLNEF